MPASAAEQEVSPAAHLRPATPRRAGRATLAAADGTVHDRQATGAVCLSTTASQAVADRFDCTTGSDAEGEGRAFPRQGRDKTKRGAVAQDDSHPGREHEMR